MARFGALGPTLLTMTAVLLSLGSALALETLAGLRSDVAVLAVVLSLTLGRTAVASGPRELARPAVTLPVVALLAGQVGNLMISHVVLGDALFAVVLSAAIWGAASGRWPLGSAVSSPFRSSASWSFRCRSVRRQRTAFGQPRSPSSR